MPSLPELLHTYLDARDALYAANEGKDQKVGVIHGASIYCVQFGKDGIVGMAVAPYSEGPQVEVSTTAPAVEAPKKRGRPPKAAEAPIPGPGSAPSAATDVTIDGATAAPPITPAPAAPSMTRDKFRSIARDIASTIGLDAAKKIIGCPIDNLDPAEFPDRVAKLEAARKETL